MNFNFDLKPDRLASDSVKWHHFDPDVLPMWVADMDFYSPEVVIQALRQRIAHGIFGYGIDLPELLEAVCERMEQRYRWSITPQDIVLVPGVINGFNLAVHAAVRPDESILVQTPVYPPILKSAATTGRSGKFNPLARTPAGSYEVDFEDMQAAIDPTTRLFLLSNPHNPVGRVYRQDELEKMAEICLRTNLVICSDEIHSDLVFSDHQHIPIASISPEIAHQAITLIAPSKTFNIPGLKCSFLIVQNPALRARLEQARQGLLGGVNVLGQAAALAAYREGQPWLDALLAYLEANRDYLYATVQNCLPGINLVKPEGTYLAWLDCRSANLPGKPCEYFLQHARVGVNDGTEFGPEGEGFIRLNFACPRSMLAEALARMEEALIAARS